MLDKEDIRPHRSTYVVELEVDSLKLIAGLLHQFIKEVEDCSEKTQAVRCLGHLKDQTECVSLNAIDHNLASTRKPQMDLSGLVVPENIGQLHWAAELEIVGFD